MATEPDSAYYTAFRARLKALREDLNYTQEEFATLLGISKANLQKYEDRSKFPLHKLERLALVTRESLEFLVTGRNRKPPGLRLVRK